MAFARQNQASVAAQRQAAPSSRDIPEPPPGTVNMDWWNSVKSIMRDHQTLLESQQKQIAILLAKNDTST